MNRKEKAFMNGLYGKSGKTGFTETGFTEDDEIYLMCFSAFKEGFEAGGEYTHAEWLRLLTLHISGCKDLKCHCKLFSKPAD